MECKTDKTRTMLNATECNTVKQAPLLQWQLGLKVGGHHTLGGQNTNFSGAVHNFISMYPGESDTMQHRAGKNLLNTTECKTPEMRSQLHAIKGVHQIHTWG